MSDSLFGNVMLGEELLDIPDTPVQVTDDDTSAVEKPAKETPADEDDELIDVVVGTIPKPIDDEEEVDSDETTKETDDETPPNTKGSSSSSPIKPFVKALTEVGFLPSVEDEDFDKLVEEQGDEIKALMELTRRSIEADIKEYKESAEGDFKSFIEARDAGLDLNQWADIQEAKSYYGSLTDDKIDDDEDLQKDLIREHLRLKNMEESDITDLIDSLETTGKLADNAKKSHKGLIKFAEAQEVKLKTEKAAKDESDKKAREENLKALRKEVDILSEVVPGIKINKQTKDKIYSNITTVVKTGPNGEQYNTAMAKRAEDPLKYAIIENYLIEMGVFDGKWDKIVARNTSKAVKELEKVLSDSKNTDFKSGKNTLGSGASDDDIDFRMPTFKTK